MACRAQTGSDLWNYIRLPRSEAYSSKPNHCRARLHFDGVHTVSTLNQLLLTHVHVCIALQATASNLVASANPRSGPAGASPRPRSKSVFDHEAASARGRNMLLAFVIICRAACIRAPQVPSECHRHVLAPSSGSLVRMAGVLSASRTLEFFFSYDTPSRLVSSPMRSAIAMWWRMERPIDRSKQPEGPVAPSRGFSVPCQSCGGGSRCTDGQMSQSKCAAMSQNQKIIGKYSHLNHAHEAAACTSRCASEGCSLARGWRACQVCAKSTSSAPWLRPITSWPRCRYRERDHANLIHILFS
ncbi:hypothetical protein C8Q74DRAFT_842869 [Fomes fomentarius]|nr:hypothetical protein C8Q74DRAFT_842869 [Fomes fomentarius]